VTRETGTPHNGTPISDFKGTPLKAVHLNQQQGDQGTVITRWRVQGNRLLAASSHLSRVQLGPLEILPVPVDEELALLVTTLATESFGLFCLRANSIFKDHEVPCGIFEGDRAPCGSARLLRLSRQPLRRRKLAPCCRPLWMSPW
jgi:hypothetical protein